MDARSVQKYTQKDIKLCSELGNELKVIKIL